MTKTIIFNAEDVYYLKVLINDYLKESIALLKEFKKHFGYNFPVIKERVDEFIEKLLKETNNLESYNSKSIRKVLGKMGLDGKDECVDRDKK